LLEQARAQLPKERASLTLALCSEAVGRVKEAREFYQAALAAAPRDPQVLRLATGFYLRAGPVRDAGLCLRRVLDAAPDGSAGNTAWARRSLAVLLAGAGIDHARLQDALKLLNLRFEGGKFVETAKLAADELTEENRARVRVLSVHGSRPARVQAAALLED